MPHYLPLLPLPKNLREAFARAGFIFSSRSDCEAKISGIPHDTTDLGLGDDEFSALTLHCLKNFPLPTAQPPAGERIGNAFIGPAQATFLQRLASFGLSAEILSGYRSPQYQSALFAARYLDGTLFDAADRYTCLPAAFSDHCVEDGAIDIENSLSLMFLLAKTDIALPFSIWRPYVGHQFVADEPWHWVTSARTKYGYSGVGARIPKTRTTELTNGISAFCDSQYPSYLPAGNEEYIFVSNCSAAQPKCVGSRRGTLAMSIADAALAVGPSSRQLITIPWGYTPLMDGKIQDEDVGVCAFKLTTEDGQSSYITPSSCILDRKLNERSICETLEVKAKVKPGQRYFLEKSLTEDWLHIDEICAFPVEYARPISGVYRTVDTAWLLPERYDEWLLQRFEGLPPYTYDCDPLRADELAQVHYSLLLSYISEANGANPAFDALREKLSSTLARYVGGVLSEPDEKRDRLKYGAVVFFMQAKIYLGNIESKLFVRDLSKIMTGVPAEPAVEDRIFLGHLAKLLRISLPHLGASARTFAQLLPTPHEVMAWLKDGLLNFLPACQIIALHAAMNDPSSKAAAKHILLTFAKWPEGIGDGESGSFLNFESFQTALPVEGLNELCSADLVLKESMHNMADRLAVTAGFLFRLQRGPGGGCVSREPASAGAVDYSLIDRFARLDFGIHAARACRFIARVLGAIP
jgi:hypothetical protein